MALARAVVREPAVFLLDEPLSNLDAKLRNSARNELKQFQRRLGTTTGAAGLILAGTFTVLAIAGNNAQARQLGYTIAFAVILDTFFVRTLLVPSAAVLLGRYNWWPSTLSRARAAATVGADAAGDAGDPIQPAAPACCLPLPSPLRRISRVRSRLAMTKCHGRRRKLRRAQRTSIFRNSASSIIGMPRSVALSNLLPGSAPART